MMKPYLLTPYSYKREPFAWWEGAFTDAELTFLQDKAKNNTDFAKVGGETNGGIVPDIRRSMVSWLECTPETEWVYNRLAHVVSCLNSQFFQFDLTCFSENFQMTNYDGEYSGMYGWHVDFGSDTTSPSRKLSLVLQLSDPVDYEGGVLELKPHGEHVIKISKKRGLIVVFPSWTLHQVTPVTQGNRQTLVSWITGPAFK